MENQNNQINTQPITAPQPEKKSLLSGNKGLIIAVIIGVIAVMVGASALIGFNSADQYKGMIQRLDNHEKQLQIDK